MVNKRLSAEWSKGGLKSAGCDWGFGGMLSLSGKFFMVFSFRLAAAELPSALRAVYPIFAKSKEKFRRRGAFRPIKQGVFFKIFFREKSCIPFSCLGERPLAAPLQPLISISFRIASDRPCPARMRRFNSRFIFQRSSCEIFISLRRYQTTPRKRRQTQTGGIWYNCR